MAKVDTVWLAGEEKRYLQGKAFCVCVKAKSEKGSVALAWTAGIVGVSCRRDELSVRLLKAGMK